MKLVERKGKNKKINFPYNKETEAIIIKLLIMIENKRSRWS